MTKAEFITAVEAKTQFVKWAVAPVLSETIGEVEKWNGRAYITTADGVNVFEVWFMVDSISGEANWQNQDTMDASESVSAKKMSALETYVAGAFDAYFVVRTDLDNNWAEVDVFKLTTGDLVASKVMVFKKGTNPITHLTIV